MIQVLLADDHAVVRRGIKEIVEEKIENVSFGMAANGQETLDLVRSRAWDILILDLTMPDKNGLALLKEIKVLQPRLPVLILSVHSEDFYAVRLLKAGASGYLAKDSAPDELVTAIRTALAGKKYISRKLAAKIAGDIGGPIADTLHEKLSDRELQVFLLIASGKSLQEIGYELDLSVKTISTFRSRVLAKLRLTSNAEILHYAMAHSLIQSPTAKGV